MDETDYMKTEEEISFNAVLRLVDTAVFTTTGKHLSHIEILVLQGSWQGRRYPEIASQNGYTLEYLKNDIGPQLWKRLSESLGEKVSKANIRAVLQQRVYQQENQSKQTEVASHRLTQNSSVERVEAVRPNLEDGLVKLNDGEILSTSLGIETLEQGTPKFRENLSTANARDSVPQAQLQTSTLQQPQPLTLTNKQVAASHLEVTINTNQWNNQQGSLNSVQDYIPLSASNKGLPNPVKLSQSPHHNLPPRDYAKLFGRTLEVKKLLEWLAFEHPTPRISIEGIGGVGKTTLLLDVAYRCLQASQLAQTGEICREVLPTFEAIVFTSAKLQNFTACGILPRFRRERTLRDIFTSIARTLKCCDVPSASFEEACEQIYQVLGNVRTLLIVDNLDALDEQQDILGFLYELPSTVKVVITSRKPTPFSAIHLAALQPTEALQLIQHQAQEKGVQLNLGESQKLHLTTGGIPAAIVYAVSQLAVGYVLQDISPRLLQPIGDFCRFYFESAVQPLQGQPAHRLLMAVAMFPKPPVREAICAVAGVSDLIAAASGLAQLLQLSLIQQQQGRYTMLPLTRGYVLAELAAYTDFEESARNRWVCWYLNLAKEHGGKDWKEWNNYQHLEQEWENITEVIEWCITRDRHTDVCQLWREVKCYTYSQGYRHDRLIYWEAPLDWLNWLIQAAQTRQDWLTAAEMMSDRAWKLTLMGQPQHLAAAGTLFTQAWELVHHQAVDLRVELAIHIAAWHIQQQTFESATQWLNQAQTLLNLSQLAPSVATRYLLLILYYQGEISYKSGNYTESQRLFRDVVNQAQVSGWRRAIFLAKNFLADIAIKQGHLDNAQQFLTECLQVAEDYEDQCSRAYTKRSLAQLERKRGHLSVASRWATEAREEFESLGMLPEAIETQALLQVVE